MDLSVNSLIFWPNVELLPDCVFLKKKKLLNVFLIFVFILKKKKIVITICYFCCIDSNPLMGQSTKHVVYLSKKH